LLVNPFFTATIHMPVSGVLASVELRESGDGVLRTAAGLQLGEIWKGNVSSLRYRMLLALALILMLLLLLLPAPSTRRAALAVWPWCQDGVCCDDAVPFSSSSGSSSSASSGIAAKEVGIVNGSEKLRRCVFRFLAPAAAAAVGDAADATGSATSVTPAKVDVEEGADFDMPRRCNRGESANALICVEAEAKLPQLVVLVAAAAAAPQLWAVRLSLEALPLNANARSSRSPARLNV